MTKEYEKGYIAGVFDLFHTGHLNLIERSKDMCDFLIVGVLSDELVIYFKKRPPYIHDYDRRRIVESIKYVDMAVIIDNTDIDKINAWNKYHFDCLFSGDDWKNEPSWIRDQKKLRQLGSDIYFFPYTANISSSEIKDTLRKDGYKGVLIWGAALNGKRALEHYGEKDVVGFIDSDREKIGSMIYGKPVLDFTKVINILSDYLIVIAVRNSTEIECMLHSVGINNFRIFK